MEDGSRAADSPTSLTCEILTVAGSAFLLGAQWWYADSEEDVKKLKTTLTKDGLMLKGVRSRQIRNTREGWLLGIWQGKANYLAAPLMASAIGDGIFIQKLDDDRFWVMASSGGCVLPGHDLIIEQSEKSETLSEWFSGLPDSTVYGDEQGSQRTAQDCWGAVTGGIKSGDFDPALLKAATISRPGQVKTIILAGAVVVMVAAVGAMASLLLMREPGQPVHAAASSLLVDAAREEQIDAARQARLRERFEQHAHALQQRHSSPAGVREAQDLIALLSQMRIDFGAARITSIDCARQGAVSEANPSIPSPVPNPAPTSSTGSRIWVCTPHWVAPASAGLLHQVPIRPDDPVVGSQNTGFVGHPFNVVTESVGAENSFLVLHGSRWWLQDLHDQFLAAGIQVISGGASGATGASGASGATGSGAAITFAPMQEIVASASGFQEDGRGLRDTPDRIIGHAIQAQWSTTLVRLRDRAQHAFLRRVPAQIDRVQISENGSVAITMTIARIIPAHNPSATSAAASAQ